MRSWVSRSEGETLTIGSELAGTLAPDGVLLLWGGLGSGKTVLAQGLAQGLGFERRQIQSPTYTLMHEYERPEGRFVHADLYRLEPEQVAALGFEEVLAAPGVKVVEWADRLPFPVAGALRLRISIGASGERRIEEIGEPSELSLLARLKPSGAQAG